MLFKIAGVWEKTTDDGSTYLKGRTEFPLPIILEPGTEILLFKSKSDHHNAPAYDLKIDRPQPKPDNKPPSQSD